MPQGDTYVANEQSYANGDLKNIGLEVQKAVYWRLTWIGLIHRLGQENEKVEQ